MHPSQSSSFDFVKQLASELSEGKFDLPPFPDIAIRVRDVLNDPETSSDNVARIVLSEPVLTTRLLRMANSALLRRGPMEITDVKTAINRLGFEVVRNAAVSQAMDTTFSSAAGGALRAHIDKTRKHSIHVAALAYILTKRQAKNLKPEEAMLAGLVHDIGRFYILTRVEAFPDLFNDEPVLEELLQEWHTGVGRAIVESWGFPEQLAEAVDEHELLDREHFGQPDITDVVVVANLLANLDDPRHPEPPDYSQIPACKQLKIDEQSCQEILQETEQEISSMSQALGG